MLDTPSAHKKLSLSKTEQQTLNFLLMQVDATSDVDLGYSVYASDKQLQTFTRKSQQQLQRALRHLEELGLLSSSHKKPFRGTPVLFTLTFPQYCQIKHLVARGRGDILALCIQSYTRRTHNPVCSAELAMQLRVKKRLVQLRLKSLVDQGIMRATTMLTYSRKRHRYVKIRGYELTEGQKPLTHFLPGA